MHNTMAHQYLPHKHDKVKMQYVHFRLHANYFLFPWKIHPEEICRQPDNQCFSITKGSIYLIKHYVHTTFTMGVS